MTITANFLLGGTDYTDRGYVATAGGTVALALEDALSTDVKSAVVRLVSSSKNTNVIPELDVDAPGYSMDPPSGGMNLTIPNEVGSWTIEVQINGGASARGVEAAWTRTRTIATVGSSGVPKTCPAERDEYDPEAGWTAAQNAMVDALDDLTNGLVPIPNPDPLTGLGVTSEHRADIGVEHGYRVARWLDRRGVKHFVPIEIGVANIRPTWEADFSDGFPDVLFDGASAMGCGLPLVTSEVFSIALRLRLPASDVTVVSTAQAYPSGDATAARVIIGADYTAGASTSITASITDDAGTAPVVASQSATHSAWHNVIIRSTGTTIAVRVNGVNGSTANTTALGNPDTIDVSAFGCIRDASDGTTTGNFTDGYLRHVVVADGTAWSDANCLTVEAALTAAWS